MHTKRYFRFIRCKSKKRDMYHVFLVKLFLPVHIGFIDITYGHLEFITRKKRYLKDFAEIHNQFNEFFK